MRGNWVALAQDGQRSVLGAWANGLELVVAGNPAMGRLMPQMARIEQGDQQGESHRQGQDKRSRWSPLQWRMSPTRALAMA